MGSLKEALFLTVWLRRQELRIKEGAMLAAAIGDLILKESSKSTVEAYKSFVDTAFPFASKLHKNTDQEAIMMMKKEADKGPLAITPIATPNPLQNRVKEMRLPDDFRLKLAQRKLPQRARTR